MTLFRRNSLRRNRKQYVVRNLSLNGCDCKRPDINRHNYQCTIHKHTVTLLSIFNGKYIEFSHQNFLNILCGMIYICKSAHNEQYTTGGDDSQVTGASYCNGQPVNENIVSTITISVPVETYNILNSSCSIITLRYSQEDGYVTLLSSNPTKELFSISECAVKRMELFDRYGYFYDLTTEIGTTMSMAANQTAPRPHGQKSFIKRCSIM